MCDCFHLAFPNWHAASSGTGAGRRLRGPEPGTEDDSICDEPSQFTEGERPRPQGSSPVEEYPEKYTDSDKECEAEHDPQHKSRSGKKTKKSGLGSMFEKRSTPKMSKLKEVHSPESGVIVKTAKDGCAEGLIYGGGGKEGIFIKEVVPESPASKSLKLKEGDQVLSATVYFDNVSYEDAIQIMEHAQAYKVKLCLKRKPDITETEPAMDSDVIPEEDLYAPEMREQGKTKRRGDARISWPKFPSFGKGRKSRFTRSHSSSEADEQRKLELSPTTSDTESPIKTQDALKGKKRHKMKLSVLTKRGRISSSEEPDTDAPTTAQTSGDNYQTASDMLSPECLESLSGETPEAHLTEDLTEVEDLRLEQNDQKLTEPQTGQHKVELISIDSTLKTADLTVAMADQESPSGIKSPNEKKKKKERSELKMKILGKDKSHKKDAKAKASPKRLKTLGASIEIADQPVNENSDVIPGFELRTELQGDQLPLDANTQIISSESSRAKSVTTQMEMTVPKVELDITDVTLVQKSPKKSDEKIKKGKDIKQKQEKKTGPTFKLPKIGLGSIATEETTQKMIGNVEECPTKTEQLQSEGPEVKEDPYDKLSKSNLSRTQLPKREDIEIPGMEDKSVKTSVKRIKEPKAILTGHYEEIQSETVQMSIDVDSVKEAVSKLPGFKLPKVDTSGVPIPEEITVIDANAQRISVKTPTKVVDTKTKHEAHFSKFDINASPEISKTTVKLPQITTPDLTSDELLTETKVDFKKSDKEMKTGVYNREDIIIPGKESAQEVAILQAQKKKTKITTPSLGISKPDIRIPDIGIDLPKQNISAQKGYAIKGEKTILLQEVTTSKTETRKGKGQIEGVITDVKIPETDSIEYIDSVGGSPAKKDGGIRLTGFGVDLDATKPKADISFSEIRGEVTDVEADKHTIKLAEFGVSPDISVNVPDTDMDINIDGAYIKILEKEEKGSKFKMPNLGISMPKVKGPKVDFSLSKKDVTLPEAKAEVKLLEAPETDITLGNVDVSIQEHKMEVEKPELEIKPLQTEAELDGQGSRFKMPKLGIKMPKIKGPEFDLRLSKKSIDVTLPESKADGKLPEVPEIDPSLGNVDVSIPAQKMKVKKPELEIKPLQTEVELDGQGSRFKMPKLGITMPKVKGPEIDFSLSKKDIDVTLPEAKAGVKLPDAPEVDITLGNTDVFIPEKNIEVEKPKLEIKHLQTEVELDGQGSKFKMPKFGIKMPKLKGPEFDLSLPRKDVDVTLPEAKAEVKLPDTPGVDVTLGSVDVSIPEQKLEVEKPELEMKPLQIEAELDGQGSKFKMPKLGIKMPKIKGPEFDLSLSKKDVDVILPEFKAEGKLPEAPEIDASLGNVDVSIPAQKMKVKKPEMDIKPPPTKVELDGQGSKFKMPKFGITMPKVKGPEIDFSLSKKDIDVTLPEAKAGVKLPDAHEADITLGKTDVSIPEKKIEVEKPELEIKTLQTEVEFDGQGSKFKMPKFGIKMPKLKGPEFDLSLPRKDVDVTLPEAKAEVKLPDTPGVDVTLGSVDVSIPEQKLEVEKPELEMKPLQIEAELDGQGSKFKMPKFGITMPKVKGPEIDFSLSKKEVDLTLPEATADVKLPDVELKDPSAKVEIKTPEIKGAERDIEGSPSKFKMPTFKLPKFGAATRNVNVEVSSKTKDIQIPETQLKSPEGVAVDITAPNIDIEGPSLDVKTTAAELDGKGSKFKMPKFGISLPKVKGPEIDLSLSKKDVDMTLPEADVKLPDVEHKELDVKVEVKAPEMAVHQLHVEGSPSKFKMPTFKLPKFGVGTPKASAEVPDMDKHVKIDGADINIPDEGSAIKIAAPSIDIEGPSIDLKTTVTEQDGKGSKFKMPHFGFSMPKVKGPKIDLSLPKKDVDVTLPEAKADVKLPEVDLGKVEVSIPQVKMEVPEAKAEVKLPEAPKIAVEMKPPECEAEMDGHGGKFKIPKFGIKMPKVKGPEFDLSLPKKDVDFKLPETKADVKLPEADLGKVDVSISEAKIEVKKPKVEIQSLQTEGELDGQGEKFKMPKFGIKMPKLKGPEFDLSLSKKDVDTRLPQVRADVKLPDAPKADVTFESVDVSIPEQRMEIEKPELEIKPLQTEVELEGQGSKFKMPKFGMSMEKVKGPEFHLGFSKKDVDIMLPETKADVNFPDVDLKKPSAEVEIKAPEIDGTEGSPSKFKMPNFSFSMPKVKGPDIDLSLSKKHADITLPDTKAEVKLPEAPKIDVSVGKAEVLIPEANVEVKKPEVQIRHLQTDVELEGQGGKFKMPKFGISMPKVKGPEFDLSFSKKDIDVTLPEAKAEVKLPDVELQSPSAKVEMKPSGTEAKLGHVEGLPSKFKMPTFKLPKFGAATPNVSVEVPDMDKDIKVDTAGLKIPKDSAAVDIAAQNVDIKGPSLDVKMSGTEGEGKGSKFKMPKFGVSLPKVHGPEIDLSLSKKDVGVKLPEAKAEVKLPEGPEIDVNLENVDVSIPEAKMEVQKPELELQSEVELDRQGSKFKMPKFGISMPKVKGPEIDFSLSKKDVDITLPEGKAEVNLPDVELQDPSAKVEIKPSGTEAKLGHVEGSPSKFKLPTFKLPKFGAATPNVSVEVPDMDKDIKVDRAGMKIPKDSAAVDIAAQNVDIKGPSLDAKMSGTEGEGKGSKFKMPKFGVSLPKVHGPEIDLSLSKKDVGVKLPEAKAEVKLPEGPEIDVNLENVDVSIPEAKMEVQKPELQLQSEVELDRQGSKFKMPKFGISMPKVKGPEIDFSLSKKDVDITLPEGKAEVNLPDVELQDPSAKVEIKPSGTEAKLGHMEGSPSKFKLPTFKLPKFGAATPNVSVEVPDMDKDIKVDTAGMKIPKDSAAVDIAAQNVDIKGPSLDVKMSGTEGEGKGSKFKMPKFGVSLPKVHGPEIDLSLSKKDVGVKLPEAKAEVKLPEGPEIDVNLENVDVSIPEAKMEVQKPELELQSEVELDRQGSKFKMPKFGISMPKVKGPEIDFSLSKKDVDITLPEGKAEVNLPDVEQKEPSAKVEVKSPEIEAQLSSAKGSPSKFKLPTFKFPKFGVATPNVSAEVPDTDKEIQIDGAHMHISAPHTDVHVPEVKAEVYLPDVEVKEPSGAFVIEQQPGVEVDAKLKKPRFSLPRFSFSKPNVKAPEVDVSPQDINVAIPEGKVEVKGGEVEIKALEGEAEVDGQGNKFKMPKFGITMPKATGPEINLSLSKKDVDITLPEGKAEVNLPDVEQKEPSAKVEVKSPEIEAQLSSAKGSPSKFKLPTFKFPKFGVATPNVSAEVPDTDKEIQIDGAHMHISAPHTDVHVPEVKAEVYLPDVEVKEPSGAFVIEQQPGVEVDAKLKKPRFSLPRFSFSKPNVKAPEVDVSPQDINVAIPEGKVEVKGGEVEIKALEGEAEVDGQGNKFKMPKFGITMPKATGPEINLSLSKKDVDVTLPEAEAKVKLPDVELKEPSAEVEINPPDIKVVTKDAEGSPSKFKMPTFKLPKFGVGTPSSTVEVPVMDKDINIDGDEEVLAVTIAAPSTDTQAPSIDIKTTGTEREGKGSRFKLPSLGFSGPHVKGPDVDLSLSKKDADVTLPEVKADVQLPDVDLKEPSANMEIKAPGIEVQTSNVEGSPSKFKMPTFKLPKFGAPTPQISVEGPDVDRDIKLTGADLNLPEAKAGVKLPDVEIKEPVISVSVSEAPMAEGDATARKTSWTLPKFSFSKTSIKSPEVDVNFDTPKVDVTLPEAKTEIQPPDIDIKESSSISVEGKPTTDLDAKLKKPRFSLPKFSFSKQSTKELEVDASLPEVDVSLPEVNVEVKPPEVELKPPEGGVELDGHESKFKMPRFGISMPKVKGPEFDLSISKKDADVTEHKAKAEVEIPEAPKIAVDVKPLECETEVDGQGSKFKIPKFGITMPKVKGPEIDLSLSKKDIDVKLQEAKAEVQLPDVKTKQLSGKVEMKAPEIEAQAGNVEASASKLKMPTFTLPKFGAATPKVSVQVPDVDKEDKDIEIDGAKLQTPKEGATLDVTAPSIDTEGLSVDVKAKGSELEVSGSKFKMPHFGISKPKVKGPEIDLTLSKKSVDVTQPEVKAEVILPSVEVKEPEGDISVPDTPTVEFEAKMKRPNWTFPKFSFSRTGGKSPDVDVNFETPKADVTSPKAKAEVSVPDVEVKGPSGVISMEEPSAAELDASLKKTKFSLPKFSFSKTSVTVPEVSAEPPHVDVSLPEGEVKVKQPAMEMKAPELEAEHDVQGTKFKLPKFGIALPKVKGPEVDLNASPKDINVTLPEVKAEIKLPEVQVKESLVSVETEGKSKDGGGSPLKFKMPTLQMPKLGGATYDVTVESETDGAKLKEDVAVNIKGPSVDIKTDMSKTAISDSETPKTETDGVGQVSPSKFKLPSFKMPKLSFSRPKPEDEHVPGDDERKDDQLKMEIEPQEEIKSPKLTLTSFGELLKNIDVEFDVSKTDKGEENLETLKGVHETSESSGKQITDKKQDTTKSPERTGWFKFPKFGLSSPSELAKISEKDERKDEKSPVGETGDEEISPTCSVQSSDAFADISSAMTSEHVGLSLSSPTKVTVKYSGPDVTSGFGEIHSNIITSTTSTGLISVEPNLPEKITILSSGVSSSSEDTLRLESGKIHVITSNIQATPEAQHAKLVTAVQVQSAGGLPLESEANKAASWTVEESQSSKSSIFGRYFTRETSSERSESKETIVITKQITHSSEPISGETASSIQRLRDSVHSEKMRFFDGAEK
ncbi:neuroblast differentiation-associated protein AHNAK-like [Seriola aureovittata]|uniref:neuroblast differentiation-associated protein AHNAK-like n=1 Tax=Seriola aureovittata TaxID=2871759 RepID=UPI0024BE042E|nr:neuroblast differentiation-associated protein AHNAK-like [Seriola aureovittata]